MSLLEHPKDSVISLFKKTPHLFGDKVDYWIYDAYPATGIIYIINNFISGHVRLRGKGNGAYPYRYLEMIDAVFGKAIHTIEVCSGHVESDNNTTTVDIFYADGGPDILADAQELRNVASDKFDRWRCDPPYNEDTAKKMYGCDMPNLYKLLEAGARVVKPGSLLFLLCAQNYQRCPPNITRVGVIPITVVPNNELRALNIYRKLEK